MLFCFFWTGQFILALGEIIFAMAGENYFALIRVFTPWMLHLTARCIIQFQSGTFREINQTSEVLPS
jgi:hypothetical protein